ncbi:MAG: hypothetical protein Q7S17_04680 [Xanthobacteraceae bacterium]|nr:hypothetical protein [Xanthobacteraceae bacterium]
MARLVARAGLASGDGGGQEPPLVLPGEGDQIDPEPLQHHSHVAEPAIYSVDHGHANSPDYRSADLERFPLKLHRKPLYFFRFIAFSSANRFPLRRKMLSMIIIEEIRHGILDLDQ